MIVLSVSAIIDVLRVEVPDFPLPSVLYAISMMRQLLDVVNQAVEVPLGVHRRARAQGKAVEPLVVAQVAEHRFNGGQSPAVESFSALAVDRSFHAGSELQRRALIFGEECHLPRRGALRVAQTLVAKGAGQAVALCSLPEPCAWAATMICALLSTTATAV